MLLKYSPLIAWDMEVLKLVSNFTEEKRESEDERENKEPGS